LAKFNFYPLGDFFEPCPSRVKAGFKEIAKWVKSGFLMIIPIYAKISIYNITFKITMRSTK
jgi:hypothetical protein